MSDDSTIATAAHGESPSTGVAASSDKNRPQQPDASYTSSSEFTKPLIDCQPQVDTVSQAQPASADPMQRDDNQSRSESATIDAQTPPVVPSVATATASPPTVLHVEDNNVNSNTVSSSSAEHSPTANDTDAASAPANVEALSSEQTALGGNETKKDLNPIFACTSPVSGTTAPPPSSELQLDEGALRMLQEQTIDAGGYTSMSDVCQRVTRSLSRFDKTLIKGSTVPLPIGSMVFHSQGSTLYPYQFIRSFSSIFRYRYTVTQNILES
jgi:hypothetical protein